jgi:hypothetical protein
VFLAAFEQVMATSRSLQADSPDGKEECAAPGSQAPMAELEPLLEELAEQIRSYSPDAQDVLEKLKAKLQGHPWETGLTVVEEQLRAYDFKGALTALNSMRIC